MFFFKVSLVLSLSYRVRAVVLFLLIIPRFVYDGGTVEIHTVAKLICALINF